MQPYLDTALETQSRRWDDGMVGRVPHAGSVRAPAREDAGTSGRPGKVRGMAGQDTTDLIVATTIFQETVLHLKEQR